MAAQKIWKRWALWFRRSRFFLCFPIVILWELSVAMVNTILIQSDPKPNTINLLTHLWFTSNLIKYG